MLRLHDYILSSDCYKVRLLLAMLGLAFETTRVDVHPGREQNGPAFRSLNPLGRIPVLEDAGLTVWDPQAILAYLALRYDPDRFWLPSDPALHAQVMMWLGFAATELDTVSRLRFAEITGMAGDPAVAFPSAEAFSRTRKSATPVDNALAQTDRALTVLEDHLAEGEILGRAWLAGSHATIADLAVFAPVILAPDAGVSLDACPAVWRWLDRVKRLDRFVVMPGVMPNLAGAV